MAQERGLETLDDVRCIMCGCTINSSKYCPRIIALHAYSIAEVRVQLKTDPEPRLSYESLDIRARKMFDEGVLSRWSRGSWGLCACQHPLLLPTRRTTSFQHLLVLAA